MTDSVTQSDHDLLVRIDERTKGMQENYVTKKEFFPVRLITYGFVGLVMVTVIVAIISSVLKTKV